MKFEVHIYMEMFRKEEKVDSMWTHISVSQSPVLHAHHVFLIHLLSC